MLIKHFDCSIRVLECSNREYINLFNDFQPHSQEEKFGEISFRGGAKPPPPHLPLPMVMIKLYEIHENTDEV